MTQEFKAQVFDKIALPLSTIASGLLASGKYSIRTDINGTEETKAVARDALGILKELAKAFEKEADQWGQNNERSKPRM